MNKREVWRYGCLILRQKSTGIVLFFWIMGFFWLYGEAAGGRKLAEEWNRPVEIFCEIPQSLEGQLEQLRELDGVEMLSRWEESVQTIEWNGYQGQILLTGAEKDYLNTLLARCSGNQLSDTMASVWVEEQVFSVMENEKKEKLTRRENPDLLYQMAAINGKDARIYGVISGNDLPEEEQQPQGALFRVYTTPEIYDELLADAGGSPAVLPEREMEEVPVQETEEASLPYYMKIENIECWNSVRPVLEQNGVFLPDDTALREREEELEALKQNIWLGVLLSMGALGGGGFLLRVQGNLWKKKQEAWVRYLYGLDQGERAWKDMYRSRIWICLLAGGLAGGILRWFQSFF